MLASNHILMVKYAYAHASFKSFNGKILSNNFKQVPALRVVRLIGIMKNFTPKQQ